MLEAVELARLDKGYEWRAHDSYNVVLGGGGCGRARLQGGSANAMLAGFAREREGGKGKGLVIYYEKKIKGMHRLNGRDISPQLRESREGSRVSCFGRGCVELMV